MPKDLPKETVTLRDREKFKKEVNNVWVPSISAVLQRLEIEIK